MRRVIFAPVLLSFLGGAAFCATPTGESHEDPSVTWQRLITTIHTNGIEAAQSFRTKVIAFEGGALGKQHQTSSTLWLNPGTKDEIYCVVHFNQSMSPEFTIFTVKGRVRSVTKPNQRGMAIITVDAIETKRRSYNEAKPR